MITFKSHQVFDHIKNYVPENPIIIEAGAFLGHETIKMATLWPRGTIHAFEPVPELFAKLKENTAHLPNVRCYQLALSDTTGTAMLNISEKPQKPGIPAQANSLLKPKERLKHSPIIFTKSIAVQTITIDDWAAQQQIDHIDFMWLDLQGYELNVLQAAPKMRATVRALYTEVEFIEAYEGQYQYPAVKQWLEAHDFVAAGKDFVDEEQWFFGNVLFVKAHDKK